VCAATPASNCESLITILFLMALVLESRFWQVEYHNGFTRSKALLIVYPNIRKTHKPSSSDCLHLDHKHRVKCFA
jgi:hypothetical protein